VAATYAPLTRAVRELIDATVRTLADDDLIAQARTAIQAVTRSLLSQRSRPPGVSYRVDGRPLPLGNAATGQCNPIAPPVVVHHDGDGRCWSEFVLGAAYECPPSLVHGGVCALVLDHMLGEAASQGLTKPLSPEPSPSSTCAARHWARFAPKHSSNAARVSKPLRADIFRMLRGSPTQSSPNPAKPSCTTHKISDCRSFPSRSARSTACNSARAFAAAAQHARKPRRAITDFEIVPTPKPVAFTPNAAVSSRRKCRQPRPGPKLRGARHRRHTFPNLGYWS